MGAPPHLPEDYEYVAGSEDEHATAHRAIQHWIDGNRNGYSVQDDLGDPEQDASGVRVYRLIKEHGAHPILWGVAVYFPPQPGRVRDEAYKYMQREWFRTLQNVIAYGNQAGESADSFGPLAGELVRSHGATKVGDKVLLKEVDRSLLDDPDEMERLMPEFSTPEGFVPGGDAGHRYKSYFSAEPETKRPKMATLVIPGPGGRITPAQEKKIMKLLTPEQRRLRKQHGVGVRRRDVQVRKHQRRV